MNKQAVIDFFDQCAPTWDAQTVIDEQVVNTILDYAGVRPGRRILDVACGTGVLIPDYLARGARWITGVDISPEMIKRARKKFSQENVEFICGDMETVLLADPYDCILVYNALPHFPDPERLLRTLCRKLKPGGTLTVAHGMSRERIDRCHRGKAAHVSMGLMHESDLAKIFQEHLTLSAVISDERMYLVTGVFEAPDRAVPWKLRQITEGA